jgi:hypothetical protein
VRQDGARTNHLLQITHVTKRSQYICWQYLDSISSDSLLFFVWLCQTTGMAIADKLRGG